MFVNSQNSLRGEDEGYKKVIEKIKKDGVCPFCPNNLAKYHKKPISREGEHWLLTENAYPYKGAKHHILLIHKKHIESFAELSGEAWSELLELARSEADRRKIGGGTFYMRFGDTEYTGASVSHLHANLISPDVEDKNRKPIRTRIG